MAIHIHEAHEEGKVYDITYVRSDEWPDLYHGVLNVPLGPLSWERASKLGTFRFTYDTGVVSHVFLFCGYEARWRHSDMMLMKPRWYK
jgi:hypothetical protein